MHAKQLLSRMVEAEQEYSDWEVVELVKAAYGVDIDARSNESMNLRRKLNTVVYERAKTDGRYFTFIDDAIEAIVRAQSQEELKKIKSSKLQRYSACGMRQCDAGYATFVIEQGFKKLASELMHGLS